MDDYCDADPARIVRIAAELTLMRQRGLEELDTPTGGQHLEDYPEVWALAKTFSRAVGAPVYGRAAAIYYLLQAAVPPYGQWGNARGGQVLDLLYFGSPERVAELVPETTETDEGVAAQHRPRGRLQAARRLTGLDDKRFAEYQHQLLLGFASFLDGFVAETVRTAATPPPPHAAAADATADTTSAPTGHGTALLSTLLAAGLVVALVLAVLQLGSHPSPVQGATHATPVTITGYAECWPDTTKPVVGVWIVAGSGGSGWADWHPLPGRPNVAWFSRTLPQAGSYVVHVGCGGTPTHWELTLASLTGVLGSGYTFTCYDVPPDRDPSQAHCQP